MFFFLECFWSRSKISQHVFCRLRLVFLNQSVFKNTTARFLNSTYHTVFDIEQDENAKNSQNEMP